MGADGKVNDISADWNKQFTGRMLRYAEFDSVGDPRYRPTLLHIRPTEVAEERILTVRWARTDSTGVATDVRYVFDFLARRTADGVRLATPVDHLSRGWKTRQVGTVRYIISPQHVFSPEQAEEQRSLEGAVWQAVSKGLHRGGRAEIDWLQLAAFEFAALQWYHDERNDQG